MSASRRAQSVVSKGENVVVCVRLRPLNRLEERTKQRAAWTCTSQNEVLQSWAPDEAKVAGRSGPASHKAANIFAFDYAFDQSTDNVTVYESIGRPIIEACMEGYHGCIFAYGQTSSGKTYTIHGSGSQPGMIPQSVETVFDYIEAHPDREFVLRVSYMEIYNEVVNDLLNPANANLRIREDTKKGIYVEGLKEDIAMSADQVFSLLQAGTSHRHIGRTNYNDVSSRSHTIFRLVIESSSRHNAKAAVKQSALNLVDLAGSENAVKAGNDERIKETGYINKSLLTLGHVIFKLSEGNLEHIPYRDSKLTRILQSSLSGRAKVAVCCNISPSSGNIEETISTLKFAARAKKIVNQASMNEKMDDTTLLKKYREEIDRLKHELLEARTQATQAPAPAASQAVDEETLRILEENEQEKMALQAKIEQLTRLILTSSQVAPPLPPGMTGAVGAHHMQAAIAPPLPPLPPSLSAAVNASAASGASSAASTTKSNSPSSSSKSSTAAGSTSSSDSKDAPPLERRNSLKRAPMGFKRPVGKGSLYGTLPRNFTLPMARRPSLNSLQNIPDMDEPSANPDDDDLLCPKQPGTPKKNNVADKSDSADDLRSKLARALQELDRTKQELRVSREHAAAVEKEIEEKDILLQEWDTWYVTANNKNQAILNEVRKIAANHKNSDADLNQLFDMFDLEQEDWNAPLVDYDQKPLTPSTSGNSLPPAREQKPKESDKFVGIMSRWKSMEQDMDM